jgi:subtilase family serine protease
MRVRSWGWLGLLLVLCMGTLAACGPTVAITRQPTATPATPGGDFAPHPYSPAEIRAAYDVTSLLQQGITGKGQTVVLIESYGDPMLQDDLDQFSAQFGLPQVTVQVLAPLGTVRFDPNNSEMQGWAGETALDAEVVHTIAPDANIVVMTSPVDETEGTIGLPEFRQLEEQAVSQHLGTVISQSWGVSEVTLGDAAGQAEIARWSAFYQQATTTEGITFTTGSGDNGATDYADLQATQLASSRTTSFPSDQPWVIAVGGTELLTNGSGSYQEVAWNGCDGGGSGGGFSQFVSTPDFQRGLPASTLSQFNGDRGVPDVSADAAPCSGWRIRAMGQWAVIGGTSAGAPLWAGLAALANQMAGHPLGYLNPALYAIGISSKAAQDFRDVTQGNNSVNDGGVQVQGFSATPGWDPVTGFGSPIADHLLPDLVTAVQGGLA